MSKAAKEVERSLKTMKSLGKALLFVFGFLFLITVAGLVPVLIFAIKAVMNGALSDGSGTITILAAPLFLIACGLSFFLLASMSRNISRGVSPFTVTHAKMIAVSGWMFLLTALLEFLTSPGFISIAIGHIAFVGLAQTTIENISLPVDVVAIFMGIVCLAFSLMWRYGALLQEQTNDLV